MACQEKVVCDQVQGCQLSQMLLRRWALWEEASNRQVALCRTNSLLHRSRGFVGNPAYPQERSFQVSAICPSVSLVTVVTLQVFELWPGRGQQLLASYLWWREKRGWDPEYGWA